MGVGFAKDAESNLKNNARLKKGVSDKYFKVNSKYKKGRPIKKKTFSEGAKRKLHLKLNDQKRTERIRILIALLLLLLFFFYFILF